MRGGQVRKLTGRKLIYFFSSNTPHEVQFQIQQVLSVPSIRQFEKYLGLPALVGREKKPKFHLHQRKGVEKAPRLERKLLSQVGREVLIKSVIQVIPTYTMCCFKLPKGLVRELESMIRKFW